MDKQSDVVQMLRSCLISSKSKLTLQQLTSDYSTLVGKRIPLAQLGYSSLEELVNSEPTLALSRHNGQIFVEAKATDKSVHIAEMVLRQKTDKKKGPKRHVTFNYSPTQYQRPTQSTRWRPKDNSFTKKTFASPRPAAVSHNQFITITKSNSVNPVNNMPVQSYNPVTKKYDIKDRLKNITIATNNVPAPPSPVERVTPELAKECSPLASTKKRLNSKMNSIERDSGNCSPTSESTTPPAISPMLPIEVKFVRTDDPVADLKSLVELYKLGELVVSTMQVKKQKFHTCKVKVGDRNPYTSYPKEFADPKEAERYCCEEALKELIPVVTTRKSLLISSDKDILERIPPMLEKHNHGLWVWQLELDYADKYNEILPADWLKVIDSSSFIQLDKYSNRHVIRHCKEGDVLQKTQKWNHFMNVADVSVPSNTIHFGEDNNLLAEITCVVSVSEIWCQQVDSAESHKFGQMLTQMEEYYNLNYQTLRAEIITAGHYYIANFDSGWHRVRAIALEPDQVQCFFIDYGDEYSIGREHIYKLCREFATAQAQAFVCGLVGLEELHDASLNSQHLKALMYRSVVLEIPSDAKIDDDGGNMRVVMYDPESSQSVNEELIPLLSLESASPILEMDKIAEVFVSNIESNGDIHIQIRSRGYENLMELLIGIGAQATACKANDKFIAKVTENNSANRLYLIECKETKSVHRVQIISWSPDKKLVQIYYSDEGSTDVVDVEKTAFYPLDRLSEVLNQYPAQAIRVRMAMDKIPENFKDLAAVELPKNQVLLLKLISYDEEKVPCVEFFKRNADGGLFCINKSIELNNKLKCENNNRVARKMVLSHYDGAIKNVPSGGFLAKPKLPELNEYFQVRVSFAVNPWNFFIQPHNSQKSLNDMMKSLQEKYKNAGYSPLQLTDIVAGRIYASKHDDGLWYRTSVIKVIHASSISVFFCDFGYYVTLSLHQLIPLDFQYMELPYQALKAKIANIAPTQSKWTMEDCEYFKQLVENRNFYSILAAVEQDALYESDSVVELVLIDTSGETDVVIADSLIDRGMAIRI